MYNVYFRTQRMKGSIDMNPHERRPLINKEERMSVSTTLGKMRETGSNT